MEGSVERVTTSPDTQADVKLMAAVAAKDPAAERELALRVGTRVRRITGLLCQSAADADDAAQTALIEILRSAGGFRFATSLERWAERIAVRTTLRTARKERGRRNLIERWLLGPGTISEPNPERVALDTLLSRLSADRRRAFVLHHALDYTVEEIAELTATPPGTVKDRLVSARKQLRRLLGKRGGRWS